MDWSELAKYVIGIILGGGVLGFIQFLINRADCKKEKEKEDQIGQLNKRMDDLENLVKKSIKESDMGDCRTQMLFMIEHSPQDKQQIMSVAEHYFKDLGGDWYMSSKFKGWAQDQTIPLPMWFKDDTN